MNPEIFDEITGKFASQGSASRVQVVFRDAHPVEISAQQWVDLSLKEGMSVSRELYLRLQEAQVETEALDKAFRFLQVRPRTENEVERHLEKKDYAPPVRRHVMEKLRDLQLLNDHQFARMYIEQKKSQMSRMELSWKLRQRGIHTNVTDTVLQEHYDDAIETRAALHLGRKQWRKYRNKPLTDRKTKVGQYLQRKGFQTSVIYAVLDELERFVEDNDIRS
ncbi:regulatory protein RecX [Alicyclobacillus sp. SO9]|uniref:regulatory protein RecX n=1 Tax=Alicyclobacillus sp. SO9 TaxID=2665646 RepID=UPI0018E7177C|nr:RecX family transcriptional regulator [Alicyclobacillus sp. SO9]QQE80875.1 RecX family transcriptional regulator [Alicyclobacillus sp. SO9]